MMKGSVSKYWQEENLKEGVATLIFCANDVNDIIHPLSVSDYELLSEGMVAFLERYRTILPPDCPIVLKIEGCDFNKKQKELIDKTIWSHFCLNLSEAQKAWKDCCKRMLLHLFYLILSSVLLYAVDGINNTILTNLAYLPFWFFGYRFVTHLVLDCYPIWKDKKWYQRLASLKLIFSDDEATSDELVAEKVIEESQLFEKEAETAVRHNAFVNDYYMDHGVVSLACKINDIEDVLSTNYPEDSPFLSEEMSGFLCQAAPFVKEGSRVSLDIVGGEFDDKQKKMIQSGLRHYFCYRIAEEEQEHATNKGKIGFFSLFMLICMIFLMLFESNLDVAQHEFAIILFWFFGDYLLEFALLSTRGISREKRRWESFEKMELSFSSATDV